MKHKNSHKQQQYRTPTRITYECPVKKKASDGSEEKCPRTFAVRGDLLKHLDDDHTLEEAAHRYTCSIRLHTVYVNSTRSGRAWSPWPYIKLIKECVYYLY